MDIVGMIVSVVGVATGVSGMFLGILNFRRDSLEALNLYFAQSRNELITKGKAVIYNSNEEEIKKMLNDFPYNVPDSIVEVITFYHHWGLMLKHHQLPFWLFYDKKTGITASGIAVVRTFKIVEPIVKYYRKNNERFAEYYEMLYNKLSKHYSIDTNIETE